MKKIHKNVNRKIKGRTILTWAITFTVISVAQFLVWILATETVVHIVRHQTDEVYGKALNLLVQSYDNSMESVRSMLNVMSLDKEIVKELDGSGDVWQNEITRRRLVSYKSQYSYIEDIFIYYIDEERVISSNTVASARMFFDVYGDMDLTYEEWQEYMGQDFSKQDVSRKNAAGKETLWILHTWSGMSESASSAVVGVKFNTAYIQGLADNFSEDNYVGVTIRNGEGDLVAESGNMEDVRQERKVVRAGESSGWTYTAYMSDKAIGIYEKGFLPILFIGLGAETLALAFACSYFLKTNYSPFTELMEYVNKQNPKAITDGSEYVYIRDSFEEIVKKSKEDKEEIINRLNRLRIYHLVHIMKNDIPIEKADRHILEEMQMGYIFNCCAVLLISGDIQDYVERRKDSFDILQKAGMGMRKDSTVYGCSFVHEGMIVCVFRLDEEPEGIRRKLDRLWEKAEAEITGKCVVAVSSLQKGCNRLGKAYEEAQFAMQGARNLSLTGILLYDEVRNNVRESVRGNRDDFIVRQVQEYIRQHYQDPDLNVGQICEEMEKSVSYISRLFKEKTGQNILYYINMVRIENAKKLLRESREDAGIGEIGKATGFTNCNSFIRIFKKYEEITPGKYRELNLFGLMDKK